MTVTKNARGQMVSDTELVERSGNSTFHHVGTDITNKVAAIECIKACIRAIRRDQTNPNYSTSVITDVIKPGVIQIIDQGYREELLKLDDNFKYHMVSRFGEVENVSRGFELVRLMPGILPVFCNVTTDESFKEFVNKIQHLFSRIFGNLGSTEFLYSLHRYFKTHGIGREWDADSESYLWYRGRSDQYMTHTALAAIQKFDEQRVIEVLNRLTNEMPIRTDGDQSVKSPTDPLTITSLDALRIIQSDVDLSETLLYWAVEISKKE